MIELLKQHIYDSVSISEENKIYFLKIKISEQFSFASEIKSHQGVLLTEWVSPNENSTRTLWFTLYLLSHDIYCIESELNPKFPVIQDLSSVFPVCNRLQRAIYELTRIRTRHFKDKRGWLNHDFKKVSGSGVHEIPVGPVHAGIIEPGHFRFSVVGERILKLETQLGYTHKGIHQLLKNTSLEEAGKIISRISGDSTVAYASAFAIACEQIYDYTPSRSIQLERSLCLERERLCNHMGDIGAIVNDAGMPALQSFFSCLKEDLLQTHVNAASHRYLMDCIKPFADQKIFSPNCFETMKTELEKLKNSLTELQTIVENHFGLQDRLQRTGMISKAQAKQLGLLGIAAKASNVDYDLRGSKKEEGIIPVTNKFSGVGTNRPEYFDFSARRQEDSNRSVYAIQNCYEQRRRSGISREASLHAAERQTQGEFGWWVSDAGSGSLPTQSRKAKDDGYIYTGDVASRVKIRFAECFESIQYCEAFISELMNRLESKRNDGEQTTCRDKLRLALTKKIKKYFGIGIVEGWRGPVTVIVSISSNEKINWCHFHDPSWQNWLALEYAVLNDIVADFPLINKSFNLSYSGHDS